MWFYHFLRPWVKTFFWILCDLHIFGRENIPQKGSLIVVANHRSWLDIILLSMVFLPQPTSFMAKEELFRNPLWRWLLRRLGAFPVSRSRASKNALLQTASKRLREGWIIGIFPEGTRGENHDAKLRRFSPGAVFMAFHLKAHIIPVGISGIKDIRLFRRPKVKVNIGTPFAISSPDGMLTHGELVRLTNEEVWRKVATLLGDS